MVASNTCILVCMVVLIYINLLSIYSITLNYTKTLLFPQEVIIKIIFLTITLMCEYWLFYKIENNGRPSHYSNNKNDYIILQIE